MNYPCLENAKDNNDEENEEKIVKAGEKRIREKENGKLLFHYIGESSRSTYERGNEHIKDLEFRRTKSHLLRHCEDKHPDQNPDDIRFGMRGSLVPTELPLKGRYVRQF